MSPVNYTENDQPSWLRLPQMPTLSATTCLHVRTYTGRRGLRELLSYASVLLTMPRRSRHVATCSCLAWRPTSPRRLLPCLRLLPRHHLPPPKAVWRASPPEIHYSEASSSVQRVFSWLKHKAHDDDVT